MRAYFWVFPVAVTHCQVMDSSRAQIPAGMKVTFLNSRQCFFASLSAFSVISVFFFSPSDSLPHKAKLTWHTHTV